MANDTIDAVATIAFRNLVHVRAQQKTARMRPWCINFDPKPGDVAAYDGLGTVEARQVTTRYAPIVFDSIEHNRRMLSRTEWTVVLPIDEYDVEGQLLDPQAPYADACVNAMERVYDRIVYAAMFATIQTGRNFENTLTFAQDGGLTVNATAGLTLAKLLELDQNWIDGEVGNENNIMKLVGISGEENTTLMQISQLTDSRFTGMRAPLTQVQNNRQFLDFTMVPFGANVANPVLQVGVDGAGQRRCFGLAYGGVAVGMWRNWRIKVQDRNDLNNTKQVKIDMVIGAVRTEGKLVQKLITTV